MRSEVHVHIGRHRRGLLDCLSVRDLPSGKVYYKGYVRLRDCSLSVQQAGHRRAVESGIKNVHAFVRGDLVRTFDDYLDDDDWMVNDMGWRRAGYNPFRGPFFYDKDTGENLLMAQDVALIGPSMYYNPYPG